MGTQIEETSRLGGGSHGRERLILTVAFVLHVAITFWCAMHHEVWSDEGDVWLLVRDANLGDMLQSASNGGVPLLFHLSVLPFAKAGLPYTAMQIVNLLYAWGAVFLVLRSPAFPVVVKVLFAFSYFPAFEFSVIPRPYALQMLLTFLVASAWGQRHERPVRLGVIVALLANTTTLGLVTAAIAGALLTWERMRGRLLRERQVAWATAVMLFGGLLAAAQLWPREGRQSVYTWVSIDTLWYALASMFFPDGRVETFVVPAVIVLGLVTYGISRRAVPVLFLWTTGTVFILIYVFVWMGGIRHAGLLTVIVFASVWIADAYGPFRKERLMMAALAVSLAWSVYPAAESWIAETKYAFSGSREVATYLHDSGLANDVVLAVPMMFWTSPLVYLPGVKICFPAAGTCGTFSRWQRSTYELSLIPTHRVLQMAEGRYRGRRWVFLTNSPLPEAQSTRFRLVFKTRQPIWRAEGEKYFVYEPVSGR